MSYGKDERHIDKHIWKLSIPLFDSRNPTHRRLSDLGERCTDLVAALDLATGGNFVPLRRQIRSALAADPTATELNDLVLDLLAT
ncbi:MAG: hypothetical protein ACRDRS_20275 [Pseudonocardiaceae bacterium]